jgi:carboxylesterase type B
MGRRRHPRASSSAAYFERQAQRRKTGESPTTRGPSALTRNSLYLDVWVPANATKECDLPVRVWLYGGGNQDGGISNPLYDGCNVASTNAIAVAINYRLGPLGFISLKDAGFGGNQGIQDILLALQWVQDNIAAFGGDPVCSAPPPSCTATDGKIEKGDAARAVRRCHRLVHHLYLAAGPAAD